MSPTRLRTAFTDLVGVRHPVVQTGMGWVAGARLVVASLDPDTDQVMVRG